MRRVKPNIVTEAKKESFIVVNGCKKKVENDWFFVDDAFQVYQS
jgi:hypothetical protein